MRIGQGYDVHKLVSGRDLILGGVKIPYDKGLDGHSDGDVLIHAIMDSLLGAAALGDIGQLFPNNDPAFKGADSVKLLRQVGERLIIANFIILNIDSTVICEKPKLAPYILQMRGTVAAALNLDITRVSVKATTEEGLGFTGKGEGVAAQAIALIADKNQAPSNQNFNPAMGFMFGAGMGGC